MGLPGLRRLDHVGFTVPDLDQAHRWLVDVLGCEYLYSLGPFRHDDSDWMATHLNVHPRAMMVENRWYRLGDQAVFEVFHYSSPGPARRDAAQQRHRRPPRAPVRRRHRRRDRAPARCRRPGLRRPDCQHGPGGGQPLDLLPRPWGMQFELVSLPGRQGLGPRAPAREGGGVSTTDEAPVISEPATDGCGGAGAGRGVPARPDPATTTSSPATGSARRRSPSGSAPAGCRCARRCGCSRPRG